MDLLEQYKQQNPKAFQEKKPLPLADEYGREYSGMIALVIRLSGGRIRDAWQANIMLLAVVVVIAVTASTIFFWPSGTQKNLPKNFDKIDQSQYAVPK